MDALEKKLKELDFREGEAVVYATLLRLGQAMISDIAREAGLKRTTVYEYLGTLLREGFVAKTIRKKRILYVPEHPKKILGGFDRKEQEIQMRKRKAEKYLPELESLYISTSSQPAITYYEGRDGLLEVYRQVVDTHQDVYAFFTPKKFFEIFSEQQNEEILMRLRENGGTLRNLVEYSEAAKKRLNMKKYDDFVKNKVLPKEFHFETDLIIFGDTVAMISFQGLVGVLIRDRAIADLQRNIFKMMWRGL